MVYRKRKRSEIIITEHESVVVEIHTCTTDRQLFVLTEIQKQPRVINNYLPCNQGPGGLGG